MNFKRKKKTKFTKKDVINAGTRKKLGVTQAQLASIFNVSRSHITMAESGRRYLHGESNLGILNFYIQFYELETGKQAASRSLETRLFLNAEYKKILPKMKLLEQDCRYRLTQLKKELEKMKEQARDAEHAIIVFSTTIQQIRENDRSAGKKRQIEMLNYLKEQAYANLLTCWEPEQAKLHVRIEAIAGEAKAWRRYRLKVTREHNPMKNRRN